MTSDITVLNGHHEGRMDPQVATVLERVRKAADPSMQLSDPTSIDRIRQAPDVLLPYGPTAGGPVTVFEQTFPSFDRAEIAVRRYAPATGVTDRALLYFHGGCWMFCDLDSHDAICRYLCHAGNTIVLSVAYRLAPEHRFPIALEDCLAALCWAHEHAAELGFSTSGISVAGDSAGANLAAALCIAARDRNTCSIASQILYYPILDLNGVDNGSWREFADYYFYRLSDHQAAIRAYIDTDEARQNPYASPAASRDLRGLPPAMIVTAELDILREEGERFASALSAVSVPVAAYRYSGVVHAFVAMAGYVDAGRDALDRGGRFLSGLTH